MNRFSKYDIESLKIYMHNYLLEIMKNIAFGNVGVDNLKNTFVEIAMFVAWVEKESEVESDENNK